MDKSEQILRSVLRSEITWFISAVMAVAYFYNHVVIPINTIQIQLSAVTGNVTSIKDSLTEQTDKVTILWSEREKQKK